MGSGVRRPPPRPLGVPGTLWGMDPRAVTLTLDFCLRVGEVLLASGAGAADVTATMRSLARHLGLRNADIDVTFVNISMQHQEGADELPVMATRQVKARVIDYEHLTRVDHLVRAVLRDELDLKAARTELGRITSTGHARPRWAVTLGLALMAAGITVQLGGDALVALLGSVSAAVIDRVQLALTRRRIPVFYQQVAGAGVASLLAVAATASPLDIDTGSAVTANIIVLLAGIGFMGALQDALTGFYITAGARITEALLSTAGIIAGVTGGFALAGILGVEITRAEPGVSDLQSLGLSLGGAAVGAGAFAYASYAPKRIVLPIALIAALALGIVLAFPDDVGRAWPVAVAAFVVGLVSYSVSGRLKVPPLVTVVSAMVPLLPGLSIYRGLTLLAEEGNNSASAGLLALFGAASIAVSLAAGVILGEYVAQPVRREARRLEVRLAGPRLVGPVGHRTRRQRRQRPERSERRERRERREQRSVG